MAWGHIRQLLLRYLERDLAESKYMRRLAQLTIYHFFRLKQEGQARFLPSEDFLERLKVFSTYFKDNLHKELQNFQLPSDEKDAKNKSSEEKDDKNKPSK